MFGQVVIELSVDHLNLTGGDAQGVGYKDKDKLGIGVLKIGRQSVPDYGAVPRRGLKCIAFCNLCWEEFCILLSHQTNGTASHLGM